MRLRAEAKARMKAKFGGGNKLGGVGRSVRLQGDPNHVKVVEIVQSMW